MEKGMLRVEALKLAYETAYKLRILDANEWKDFKNQQKMELYDNIFELAEENFNFIMGSREPLLK